MQIKDIVLRIIVLVILLIGIISYIPELLGKDNEIRDYTFRSEELLNNHYEKHGRYMGYASKEDYEAFASNLVNYCKQNKGACEFKYEQEDSDEVYQYRFSRRSLLWQPHHPSGRHGTPQSTRKEAKGRERREAG